jgi:dienelactone hydrolase
MLPRSRAFALAASIVAVSAGIALAAPRFSPRTIALARTTNSTTRAADDLRVYGDREVESRDLTHRDARLLTMRGINTVYALPAYPTRAAWEAHADSLRHQILFAAGLLPAPPKTPLAPRIFGRLEREGYSIEKVYFQSHPGFFVAGNLYRPLGKPGPFPAILSPHGHFERGRLVNSDVASVPARAVNLARQGYVVLTYDMVGYDDTKQVNHSFASDPQSELWGINLLGLQLWNGIRALDFIRSLPDVDTTRVGLTGASGGATQVFLLTATDTVGAIRATAPVNMISAEMQGGDLCENAPGLRIGTFNVEIAALSAPRPMLMVSTSGDWTAHTRNREYPMMRALYRLYGAEDRVSNAHFDFPHNYNRSSREAVYPFLARELLGDSDAARYRERPVREEQDADVLVFLKRMVTNRDATFADLPADSYTPPPVSLDEAGLKSYLRGVATDQVTKAWPMDGGGIDSFRRVYGRAMGTALAATTPTAVESVSRGAFQSEGSSGEKWLVARARAGDWIPGLWLGPSAANTVTLLLSSDGKAVLGTPAGAALARSLVASGRSVFAADLFGIGEHVLPEGTKTERNDTSRFFDTYNRTDVQERVQDVLTSIAFLRARGVQRMELVGSGDAGGWALLAAAVAGGGVDRVVAFGMDSSSGDPAYGLRNLVPGLFRIGGLGTAAALIAPAPVLIAGSDPAFAGPRLPAAFAAAGAPKAFQRVPGATPESIVRWLGPVDR